MKLPVTTKLGYSVAAMGGGLCYVLFYSYFIFFLTNFAGVNPAWAGSISLIVVIWDAVTDPVIGYLSDRVRSSSGRRRPFILYGIIPWIASVALMFVTVQLGEVGKFVFYLLIALVFWTAYTIVMVPYNALGAELTENYSERASLRLFAQFFSSGGTMLGSSFTLLLVEFFAGKFGVEPRQAWFYVAVSFALVSGLALFITWASMKGKDKPAPAEVVGEPQPLSSIFVGYWELVRDVKPLKWMLLSIATFMCGNSLYGSGIVYAFNDLLGYTPAQVATVSMLLAVIGLVGPFVLNILIRLTDKKNILTVCLAVSTVSLLAFRFIGIYNTVTLYIYLALYAISNLSFWGLFWSFVYDCCEVDFLVTGKTRQGAMTSIASMIQKFGSAVSMWMIGMILAAGGYNGMASQQTEGALKAILNLLTVYPGILTALSLVFLLLFPINAGVFAKLQKAIADKNATGEFSSEGLNKIL